MKFISAAVGAILAGLAIAHPVARWVNETQSTNIDITILQFALTLEHLENVFYKSAFAKFTAKDFADAGYGADYYNNLEFIALDEEVHVEILSSAIVAAGSTPNAACTYSFPYTDVVSFITLSAILEGVGTSAYLAGAPLITSKDILTVAGSILVTEALHTSMQRGAINEVPMANPFGTPLDPNSVFTIAISFIISCPASNMALPFTPFPSLAIDGSGCTCEEPNCHPPMLQKRETVTDHVWKRDREKANKNKSENGYAKPKGKGLSDSCSPPTAGANVIFHAASSVPAGSFVTFVSGLKVVSVPGMVDGMKVHAAVPAVAEGQTYVFITSSDQAGTLSDAAVLFGPAILEVSPPPPTINFSILK